MVHFAGAAGDARDSEAFQRLSWEALRKSVNGLVNRLNASNVAALAVELFRENLVRARGLFTRALLVKREKKKKNVLIRFNIGFVFSRLPLLLMRVSDVSLLLSLQW